MKNRTMRILLAVDGSENSKRAILEAKAYSKHREVEITLLTVLTPIASEHYNYLAPPLFEDANYLKKIGSKILAEAKQILALPSEQVHEKIQLGHPADEILSEAKTGNYDLIILGSRGLGGFSRSILGSVSNKVLNHAEINVLVVK